MAGDAVGSVDALLPQGNRLAEPAGLTVMALNADGLIGEENAG
jgi:hypothetical protein